MTIYTELREFGRPRVQVSVPETRYCDIFRVFPHFLREDFFEHVCVLMSSPTRCLLAKSFTQYTQLTSCVKGKG
jgi:hypothetical protein